MYCFDCGAGCSSQIRHEAQQIRRTRSSCEKSHHQRDLVVMPNASSPFAWFRLVLAIHERGIRGQCGNLALEPDDAVAVRLGGAAGRNRPLSMKVG